MKGWDDYQFILALARHKTVRGAAQTLGVNHSTVSRRLAWLNQSERQVLFERIQGGYQITEFGQNWLTAAEEMEAVILSADRKQRANQNSTLTGKVSISVSVPIAEFLLSNSLGEFRSAYPNIQLCIDATEVNVNLDRSEADVVLRSAVCPPEHLVGRRLIPYSVGFYGNREYMRNTLPQDYSWIGSQDEAETLEWIKDSPYPEAPLATSTTGYHMRYLALSAGMGLARAACFMADQNPKLVRLPNTDVFESLDLWVLTHPDLRASPRIRAVMGFLADTILNQRALIIGDNPIV